MKEKTRTLNAPKDESLFKKTFERIVEHSLQEEESCSRFVNEREAGVEVEKIGIIMNVALLIFHGAISTCDE